MVTYLATESEDQKHRRIALKLPAPTYSFTVETYNGPTERKRSDNRAIAYVIANSRLRGKRANRSAFFLRALLNHLQVGHINTHSE